MQLRLRSPEHPEWSRPGGASARLGQRETDALGLESEPPQSPLPPYRSRAGRPSPASAR